jgi:methylglutaconyl-CoA hydratase
MSYKFVEVAISNHIATVTLARVDALNALSLEFAAEIAGVFKEMGDNDDVRVAILCSKAKIFCAGLERKPLIC